MGARGVLRTNKGESFCWTVQKRGGETKDNCMLEGNNQSTKEGK